MSSFRFQARYGLFTYPQCGSLDASSIVNLFDELRAECIVGKESHQDGGTHFHAFVDFKRRYRTRDCRQFDVEGQHPNIQPTFRDPCAGWDYATKDGEICGGRLERPDPSSRAAVQRRDDAWERLRDAATPEEFWRIARQDLFRDLVKSFNSFNAYAEWHYRVDRAPYQHPEEYRFNVDEHGVLGEWVREYLDEHAG